MLDTVMKKKWFNHLTKSMKPMLIEILKVNILQC